MEEKKYFTDENSKEEFKELCVAVFPQIKAILLLRSEVVSRGFPFKERS